jgi:hypothetical protein
MTKHGEPWTIDEPDGTLIVLAECALCGTTLSYDPRFDEEVTR